MAGFSPHNARWLEVTRHQDFADRVAEHMAADRASSGISLPWIQQRLLSIAMTDPALCFETAPHSSRLRPKNILDMPPQIRALISEVGFDKHGQPRLKFHDPQKALEALARMAAPSRVEVSGPGGSPLVDLGVSDPVAFEAELRQIIDLKAEAEAEAAPPPRVDADAGEEAT